MMFNRDEFAVEMVLKEQCAALKKAVDEGIDRAREPDLAQEYMMSVRFLAIQQFVFLGLQGIEFALKCILTKCRVPFKKKHSLAVLFESAFKQYPHLHGVMQEEFDFWKGTATHIASEERFLHQESRFIDFLKKIDAHNYQVDTRYFFLSDSKKSEDRIQLLLNRALDPDLLVHLWDKLNVFYLHEFVHQSRQKARADERYFRWWRWRHSPYGKHIGRNPGDSAAERLGNELLERKEEYLRTGKAADFMTAKSAWEKLQRWNEKHGIDDDMWISYKKTTRGSE